MSLIRKHGAVLQAWACLDLVTKAVVIISTTWMHAYECVIYDFLLSCNKSCPANKVMMMMMMFLRFSLLISCHIYARKNSQHGHS